MMFISAAIVFLQSSALVSTPCTIFLGFKLPKSDFSNLVCNPMMRTQENQRAQSGLTVSVNAGTWLHVYFPLTGCK